MKSRMNHTQTGASLSSTTRLSASAKPFTLNRCTRQPSLEFPVHSGQEPALYSPDHCSSDPFSSLLDSFPKFNLGAKGNSVFPSSLGGSGFAHEAAAATFPIDIVSLTEAREESLSQHPSMDFQGNDDFVVLNESDFDMFKEFPSPVYCSNTTGLGSGTYNGSELNHGKQGKDYREDLFRAGNDGDSAADRIIRRKGMHAVDGTNLCKEASDGIFNKGNDSVFVKETLYNSRGKMNGVAISSSVLTSKFDDSPFIFSTPGSDMSSSAKSNDIPHSQGCHTLSGVTRSVFISSGATDGQDLSEAPSSISNVASDSVGGLPAEIHGSSSDCSVLLPFDSSRDMDLLTGSWGTVDDKHCSSPVISGAKDSFVILNADGKGTDDGNKEEPNKIDKSVSFKATDYSISTTNEIMLKSNSSEDISIKTSSRSGGDSDSDLDSPCWKGKMTYSQSPSEILGPVHIHNVEKDLRKYNSLNPLAPQFFPSNAEGSSRLGGKKVKDSSVSCKSSAPLAVNLLPGENRQMKTFVVDARPVELTKGVEPQHSNNMNESVKAFDFVSDTKCTYLLNSTCMTQPVSIENFSTGEETIVAASNVEGRLRETKDAMAKGSIRDSFPTKCHSPTPSSSSSQAVTNLFETLQAVSKSLIDSPKLDVPTMVNAMRILSELLVQTSVHGLDSYKQHDHDTIQDIINNLSLFSAIYSGQMVSVVQSTHSDSPDSLGRSSELPKHAIKGIEEASVDTLAVLKMLHNQNDNRGHNSVSKAIAERGQYSVSSSSDVGVEKGNEIVQAIRGNLGKSLDVEEHLYPQALLYKKLWLDAEAAMCHMRRKIYLMLMETGMDINHTDLVDLWRG